MATTKKSTPITGVLKAVVRAFLLSLIVAGWVIYGTKILFGKPINIPGFSSGFTSGILLLSQRVAMVACMRFIFGNVKKLTFFIQQQQQQKKEIYKSSSGINNTNSNNSESRGTNGHFSIGGFVRKSILRAIDKFKANPKGAMFIPIVAAFVGYITNWLAVKMIFYPVAFWGPALWRALEGTLYGFDVLSPWSNSWQDCAPPRRRRRPWSPWSRKVDRRVADLLVVESRGYFNLLFTRILKLRTP